MNHLPRLRGEVVGGHVFVTPTVEDAAGMPLARDPRTGLEGSWIPAAETLEGRFGEEEALAPAEFVVLQVEACLRDAASEFADVTSAEQFLDGVAEWAPLLVARLRSRHPVEVIAAVRACLTDLRVSSRDPRVFDALLDADPSCPEPLAEQVAGALSDTITYVHLGPDGDAPLIELDAQTEDALRACVCEGHGPEPVYEFEGAAELLRMIEDRLRTASGELPAVIVTSDDLRRHVRRLVAGQFNRLSVLSRGQVGRAREGAKPASAAGVGGRPPGAQAHD